MRGWMLFLLLPFSACTTISRSRLDDFDRQFSVQEVADKTYVVTDKDFYNSNVLVAAMPDQTVLIASSPYETKGTEALLSWIEFEFNPRHIVAINTHFHSDGTGGNEAYKAHGVEIWASDLTRQWQEDKAGARQADEAASFAAKPELEARIRQRKVVLADQTFPAKEGHTFNFSGEKVEVIYPGPAHTIDNMVVYLPQRQVLFGGCMIRPADALGNLVDADIPHWAESVATLKKLEPRVVIAGHDAVGGKELIERTEQAAKKAAALR